MKEFLNFLWKCIVTVLVWAFGLTVGFIAGMSTTILCAIDNTQKKGRDAREVLDMFA